MILNDFKRKNENKIEKSGKTKWKRDKTILF